MRELFEQEPPPPPRKTRAELMKDIDADYYGYRDDDDGILLPLENRGEQEVKQNVIDDWKSKHDKDQEEEQDSEMSVQKPLTHVPSQQDIQEALLARKKQELLDKYVL